MNAPAKKLKGTLWWATLQKVLVTFPFLGGLLGAVLFPIELLLVTLRRKTLSTEVVVCVRR
jgi:hypothetical protein